MPPRDTQPFACHRALRQGFALALLWTCSLFAAILPPANDERPWLTVRRWSTQDGLPQNNLNAIAQTPDGYLWIGTYAGLVRFDGQRFVIFNRQSEPSLPSERIAALQVADDGRLLIGSEDGRLFSLGDNGFDLLWNPSTTRSGVLMSIGCDEHQDIWLADREGNLTRVRDGHWIQGPTRERTPRGPTKLARDAGSGALYLLHLGVVARVAEAELRPLHSASGGPLDARMVGSGRKQGIWVLTNTGARHFDGESWAETPRPIPSGDTGGITELFECPDGTLALASSNSGILLLDTQNNIRRFGARDALGDKWVRCMLVDREDILWAGTSLAGLAAIHTTNFQLLRPPLDWDLRPIKTVSSRQDGGVWAGTEGDGLYLFCDGRWNRFGSDASLYNLYVWSVLEDTSGRVWTGTWGGGLFVFDGVRFARVPGLEDPTESIASLLATRDGSIWIGTTHGLWRRRPTGEVERYGADHGLANVSIRSLAEAPDGSVWFGHANGDIGRWRRGTIELVTGPTPFAHETISALYADERGALWIGTLTNGLFRYDGTHFFAFDETSGLPRNNVSSISADGGWLWLDTASGILRVERTSLESLAAGRPGPARIEVQGAGSAATATPRSSGALPSACRTADGVRWFAATTGLLRHDPTYSKPQSRLAPRIESVRIDGHALPPLFAVKPSSPLEIAPGTEQIEFRFTAPSFRDQTQIRFRHRLRGDRTWVESGPERKAVYQLLHPGAQVFELEARIGTQTARIEQPFTIRPTFWQRRSVQIVGYLLAAALIGWVVHVLTLAAHRRRLRNLRRLQALDRERTRIARDMHDDLGISLTRINLMTQSALRELARPAEAAQRLGQIADTARQLTHKMDEIVWAVSPRHDSLESVAHYLSNFAQDHLAEAAISCRLDVPTILPQQSVEPEIRHHLFLAFHEAINNVIKHAKATQVRIALQPMAKTFTVIVEDNGCGLPAPDQASNPRDGLNNMQRRLAEIGGQCTIGTGASSGVRVTFTLPFAHPDDGLD